MDVPTERISPIPEITPGSSPKNDLEDPGHSDITKVGSSSGWWSTRLFQVSVRYWNHIPYSAHYSVHLPILREIHILLDRIRRFSIYIVMIGPLTTSGLAFLNSFQ